MANGSIVNLPTGEQIFLGVDGIHLFNGISAPLIQSPINQEIRDGLNQAKAHKAWGVLVIEQDEAWIGVPMGDQTSGETVYKYNYLTGVCYKDTRTGINTAWRASTSSGLTIDDMSSAMDTYSDRFDTGELGSLAGDIHFGSTAGLVTVQSLTSNSDNGNSIPCVWAGKDFISQDIGRMERWLELHLEARGSGTLTCEYSLDGGDTWYEFSNSPLTLSGSFPADSSPQVLYCDVISTKFRPRFRNNTTTDTIEIKQFLVGFLNREQK